MKTFKQFINENKNTVKNILRPKSEEEIKEIYGRLSSSEKLKYISVQRGGTTGVNNHIYMYPPIKIGKINNTDAFVTFFYNYINQFYGDNDLVFHIIYNEMEDKKLDDIKFDFTYINYYQIENHNHKGKFIHHRDQELILEIDNDYLDKIVKISESPDNIKLNDEYYEMKKEIDRLRHKENMTDEERLEYTELNMNVDTISNGYESKLSRKNLERRKSMTPEERKKMDDDLSRIAREVLKEIEEEKKNKD